MQNRLQIAAMDRKLRGVVTGVPPAGLAVNQLAVTVVEQGFARCHRDAGKRGLQSERSEFFRRVRQYVDAETESLDLGRGLVDAARYPGAVQCQGERQPADSGADDDDVVLHFHDLDPVRTYCTLGLAAANCPILPLPKYR